MSYALQDNSSWLIFVESRCPSYTEPQFWKYHIFHRKNCRFFLPQLVLIVHKADHCGFCRAVENRREGCCTWRNKAEVTKWHTHIQEGRGAFNPFLACCKFVCVTSAVGNWNLGVMSILPRSRVSVSQNQYEDRPLQRGIHPHFLNHYFGQSPCL